MKVRRLLGHGQPGETDGAEILDAGRGQEERGGGLAALDARERGGGVLRVGEAWRSAALADRQPEDAGEHHLVQRA